MTQPSLTLSEHPDEEINLPDEQQPVSDASTPVADAPADSSADSPEVPAVEYLQIDRKNLHKEIARLQREDPDFANAFNTEVGRKAARQHQSQIEELKVQNEAYRKAVRRIELMNMPAADVNSRFRSDPNFAREYSELIHYDPEAVQREVYIIRLREEVERIFDYGISMGMSPERAEELRKDIASGKYNDARGEQAALLQIQRDVWAEVSQTPSANQVAATVQNLSASSATPSPESPALTSGPDMSPAGGKTSPTAGKKYLYSQIAAMNPDEHEREFPGERDFDIAVTEGRVDFNR